MTLFDLLFLVLLLTAVVTLVGAAAMLFRGQGRRALRMLGRLVIGTVVYVGIVYAATALSKQTVLHPGDPDCSDDWCLAVDSAQRTASGDTAEYDVKLRIFSRALRVAQREMVAKDVYLVDTDWRRYDPAPTTGEIPLNTLLQAGESVTTHRFFHLPAGVHGLGLMVERASLPVCVIIGECGAFHKATMIRID